MENPLLIRVWQLALILVCVSCNDEVEILLPPLEKQVVVNGIMQMDSILSVSLSESYNIFHDSTRKLENATVKLYRDQLFEDSLWHVKNGIYNSSVYLECNATYELEIVLNDQLVHTADIIPEKPFIENIERVDRAGVDADGYQFEKAIVTLQDPGNSEDYYEVRLGLLSSNGKSKNLYPYTEEDLILINEGLPFFYSSAYPFSDELFNGSIQEISFNYYTPKKSINDSVSEQYPDYCLIVEVRKTSRDYYLFRRSFLIQQHAKYPDFWDGLGNPVSLYSNVNGGLGIFAAYSSVTDTIYKP